MMGSFTGILHWHVVLLLMFIHTSFAESCKNATYACLNDGECVEEKCVCPSGYSGSTCSNSSTSVVVLVLVCILPLITWSIVCCYGCSTLRKSKERRRLRQLQLNNNGGSRGEDDGIPLHDDPPCYDQAVYSNPITISGLDENPDWTLQGEDALIPPPHYDDLKFIHKHLMDLGDELRVEDESSTSPLGSIPEAGNDETTSLEPASHLSFPVSTESSQPKVMSDTLSIISDQEVGPSQLSQTLGTEEEGMDGNKVVTDGMSDDEAEDIDEIIPPSIVKLNQSVDTESTSADEDDAG